MNSLIISLAKMKAIVDAATMETAKEVQLSMILKHSYKLGEEVCPSPASSASEHTLEMVSLLKSNNWRIEHSLFRYSDVEGIKQVFMREAAETARMRLQLKSPETSEQDAEDIRAALASRRNEKKTRKDRQRQSRLARKLDNRSSPIYAPRLYRPEQRPLPAFSRQPQVSDEAYNEPYEISTQVFIAGNWYLAKVDPSSKSAIDTRLAPEYFGDEGWRPEDMNNALFTDWDWGCDHGQRSCILPLTFEALVEPQELCEVYCLLLCEKQWVGVDLSNFFEETRCYNEENEELTVILGNDVFLPEQATPCACVEHYKESGQTEGTMRLLDGTRVKVYIKFADDKFDAYSDLLLSDAL